MIRVGIDTNILVYVAGAARHDDDLPKVTACRRVFQRLRGRAVVVVPVQVQGELYRVLTRHGIARDRARDIVLGLTHGLLAADSTSDGLLSALDLATTHKLQIWDALILNAAAEAGCSVLLSEDMSEGFMWRGTVIVNPLAATPDERFTHLLA